MISGCGENVDKRIGELVSSIHRMAFFGVRSGYVSCILNRDIKSKVTNKTQ